MTAVENPLTDVKLHKPRPLPPTIFERVLNAAGEVELWRAVNSFRGCFVAGTLVHTKNGLMSIEKIRVGDFVLSQPEAKGELAYKRVVKTFVHENKEVYLVDYGVMNPLVDSEEFDVVNFWDGKDASDLHHLVVTPNHPFWVKGIGWTSVNQLEPNHVLELKDGSYAVVLRALRILVTEESGIGWTYDNHDDFGPKIDLRNDAVVVSTEDVPNDYIFSFAHSSPDAYIKRRVYNFEVEGFHTYCVGEQGVWVLSE